MRKTRCDATLFVLLALICATTIFSTTAVQAFVVMMTVALFMCRMFHYRVPFRRTPFDAAYIAFIVARLLSVAFSENVSLSLPALYLDFFFYVVFFLVTQTVGRSIVEDSLVVLSIIKITAVVAATIGIAKVLFSISPVASSITAGVYTLGAYLCVSLPLVLLVVSPSSKSGNTSIRYLMVGLMFMGITLTLDRVHWAGMLLSILLIGFFYEKRILLLSLGLATVAIVAFPYVRFRIYTIIHFAQYMSDHDTIWRGALLLYDKHPLMGFGPRTFHSIFPLSSQFHDRGVSSWHNDYLQVYMESGLLGLVPLFWLIVIVYRNGWNLLKRTTLGNDVQRLGAALLLSLTVIFLVGGILDTLVGITFRILLGLYAVLVPEFSNPKGPGLGRQPDDPESIVLLTGEPEPH